MIYIFYIYIKPTTIDMFFGHVWGKKFFW